MFESILTAHTVPDMRGLSRAATAEQPKMFFQSSMAHPSERMTKGWAHRFLVSTGS